MLLWPGAGWANPTDGLVAYWSFDRPSNPGYDDSGNGQNGTVYGATWTTQGRVGGALEFDGSGDDVYIADHPSQSGMTRLALEAWIYPTDAVLPPDQYHMTIISKWGPSTYPDDSYNLTLMRDGGILKPGLASLMVQKQAASTSTLTTRYHLTHGHTWRAFTTDSSPTYMLMAHKWQYPVRRFRVSLFKTPRCQYKSEWPEWTGPRITTSSVVKSMK